MTPILTMSLTGNFGVYVNFQFAPLSYRSIIHEGEEEDAV